MSNIYQFKLLISRVIFLKVEYTILAPSWASLSKLSRPVMRTMARKDEYT